MGLKRGKETTATKLVMDYLRRVDDMVRARTIADATQCDVHKVNSALWSLHNYKCVELVESQGSVYWFALPETMDQRVRTVDERTPEGKPRRKRMKKIAKDS